MPSRSSLRRIGALMVIPVIMLLGACGTKYDLTIHGDTVDQSILMWDSKDQMTESDCSEDGLSRSGVNPASDVPEGVEVKYNFTQHDGHPACEIKATNIPLSQFNGQSSSSGSSGSLKITHENGHYDVTMPLGEMDDTQRQQMTQLYGEMEISISITFPGEVTEASGNAEKKGNIVTWANVLDEKGSLHAVGKDSGGVLSGSVAGVPWLWIIVGAVVVLVIIVVIVLVVRSGKKKQTAPGGYPGQPMGYAPQPGQQPYSPQQYPAQQPGYPQQGAQPVYPPQQQYPGQPGQNPQQGYNPNGQY